MLQHLSNFDDAVDSLPGLDRTTEQQLEMLAALEKELKVQQNELSDAIREAKVRGSIYGMMGFGVCQCDWIVGSKQCAVYGYAYEQVQQEQDTSTGRQVLAALNASR